MLNLLHFMIIYLNMKKPFHRGLLLILSCNLNSFVCSYPYSEEHHEARSYLRARCPAWCDRILLSHSFKNIVNSEVRISFLYSPSHIPSIIIQIDLPTYNIVGYNVCVGDHKVRSICPRSFSSINKNIIL